MTASDHPPFGRWIRRMAKLVVAVIGALAAREVAFALVDRRQRRQVTPQPATSFQAAEPPS